MRKTQNRFGAALNRLFIAKGLSLHKAGAILGQHHTVLSTVTRGVSQMSPANLDVLLRGVVSNAAELELSQGEALELAINLHCIWLEDMILQLYQESIAIVRRGQAVSQKITDPRARAIAWFDAASKASPAVAEWLVATHAVMEHPVLHGEPDEPEEAGPSKQKQSAKKSQGAGRPAELNGH